MFLKRPGRTVNNVRNCDYRAEFDYTCRWETRTYDYSQLRGVDTYIVYWGSPWIAHTMLSFEFGKDEYIVFTWSLSACIFTSIFFRVFISASGRRVTRITRVPLI